MFEDTLLIIDAGHGGRDPGAAANGYLEKHLNLKMAIELKKLLKIYFSYVITTRDDDIYLDSVKRNNLISRYIDDFIQDHDNGLCICISIHFNELDGNERGCEIIYPTNADGRLAKTILKHFAHLGLPNSGTFQRDSVLYTGRQFYTIESNYKRIQSLTLHCLYMDHPNDITVLEQEDFFEMAARKILNGILEYLFSFEH